MRHGRLIITPDVTVKERVDRLGDSGVHTLGDTSAFVNPAGQTLLTRQGKTRTDGVGIVFEFYIAPL